jgi:predicted hydrocarbon binding protein/KaiC/GvpD/RAD55 family RecA-like ATPase
MEKRGLSLAEIQDVPKGNLILLSGPPGAGKSTFCQQVVLNGLAAERPVIFVTTEQSPNGVAALLKERGIGEPSIGELSFVDAFTETVGMTCTQRPDTICANCADLNSLSMATTKLHKRLGQKGILLAFDSLTSPYLFCGGEVTKFMRLFLARFAAEGNSVVALIDEGCGKHEDLVAMMSIANGVIRAENQKDKQLLEVVKHPNVMPSIIEVPIETEPTVLKWTIQGDPVVMKQFVRAFLKGDNSVIREDIGDLVNLFWPNLAHWSGMLWDPEGFPKMIYDLNKEDGANRENLAYFPWYFRFMIKVLMPKNLSRVKDMKKLVSRWPIATSERSGILEYLEDISKTDEHYLRVHENSDCVGFENIGATIASHIPPMFAGCCMSTEMGKRDWNAIETKCIGLGDPYCEFKLVPGEISELKSSLEKSSSIVERIHERLLDRLTGYLLREKPLPERSRLDSDVHIHVACHAMGFPHLGERYRMAQRMGGARSGRIIGQRLMKAGLKEGEAIKRVIDFMNYCKVGGVTLGETIRIRENCEALRTKLFTAIKEPSCFFTTGFLNGLFSAVKNQHVREVKCIVAGDHYCEWEIV